MSAPLTLEQLRVDIAQVLGEDPSQIFDEDSLFDLGLDSIRVMTLVQRWTAAGARITFAELAERPTLGEWWTLISAPREELA